MKRNKLVFYFVIFLIFAYRIDMFWPVIKGLDDVIYYGLFYIRSDSHNMMNVGDIMLIFTWQICVFSLLGTEFKENILSNENILYPRANNRLKIYTHFAAKLLKKIGTLYALLVLVGGFILKNNQNNCSIKYLLILVIVLFNFISFINVFSFVLDVEYLIFAIMFYEYIVWNAYTFLGRDSFLKLSIVSVYINDKFELNMILLIVQISFFIITNLIGIWRIMRKEAIE